MAVEIRAFSEADLDAAGSLLAARHREHRAAEPLLSERFEHAGPAREAVASLWAQGHASGAVAFREGEVAGFLLGTRKDDRKWGANVWVEAAGYAVDEPELVRDLYAFSARRWMDEGRTRHYALVPALDAQVCVWFRLSFGAQQAHGITEVHERPWPPSARRAAESDLEALVELAPLISEHQSLAPVFSGIEHHEDAAGQRARIAEEIANEELGELVYERDGRVVAAFEVAPVEEGSIEEPEGAAYLTWAASLPGVRRSGAGVALTDAAFAWAHGRGHPSMLTDWRETNLLSSRFWPARGFRRCFVRLYRSIP
jgi:ribosomal protein S18 acetylase RimI-like enzyme